MVLLIFKKEANILCVGLFFYRLQYAVFKRGFTLQNNNVLNEE